MRRLAAITRWITAVSFVLILAGCIDRDPSITKMPAIKSVPQPTLVSFKLLAPIEGVGGIPWPTTDKAPDSSAMFQGPCQVHIEIDQSHSWDAGVAGGMLSQENGQVKSARLYLTTHPVSLDEALELVGAMADKFGVSNSEPYREYREKLTSKRPAPIAGSVQCANCSVTKSVALTLELMASVREDGWFVQLLFYRNI